MASYYANNSVGDTVKNGRCIGDIKIKFVIYIIILGRVVCVKYLAKVL